MCCLVSIGKLNVSSKSIDIMNSKYKCVSIHNFTNEWTYNNILNGLNKIKSK